MPHQMTLMKTHPSDAEEWLCQECGRHILIKWTPYNRIIMEVGDARAQHGGGKGGLSIGAISIGGSHDGEWADRLYGIDFGDSQISG